MPEQPEGSPVGTADMHGGGVTFKDRDGNDVSFEVVRLGTTKELETVKGALVTRTSERDAAKAENTDLRTYNTQERAKAHESSNAYSTEKEVSAELTKANQGLAEGIQRQKDTIADLTKELAAEKQGGGQLKIELTTARDDLVAEQKLSAELRVDNEQLEKNHANLLDVSSEHLKAMRFERDAAIGEKEALSTSCDNFKRALLDARAELTQEKHATEALKQNTIELSEKLDAARAELARLVDVKAQVEEINTALEVSQKDLSDVTKANQDHIDAHVVLTSELGTARGELNVSRQALADIKAELLTEGDRFKTILDTLAEKIVGE